MTIIINRKTHFSRYGERFWEIIFIENILGTRYTLKTTHKRDFRVIFFFGFYSNFGIYDKTKVRDPTFRVIYSL